MKISTKKLSIAEQARIARRLSTLLGAGISLIEAVTFMKKPVFVSVIRDISKGMRCSDAFHATAAFDRSLVEMVKIGEQSGTLADALARAAASLESRDALSRKITGAMIYPGFIGCATAGIAVFLVVYIFPKIIPLVTGMGIPLPLLTRILLVVSDVLLRDWPIIIATSVFFLTMSVILWKYSALFRRYVRRVLFAIPIFGNIFRGRMIVEIFRSIGLLVEHGELLPAALTSVSASIRHEGYAHALSASATLVTDGENFAASLSMRSRRRNNASVFPFQNVLFPSLVMDFIEMGERTGGMAAACSHIASIYEAEVEESIKRITQLIEPALMLGMGLTVGSIALSIVMPIYAITANLTK